MTSLFYTNKTISSFFPPSFLVYFLSLYLLYTNGTVLFRPLHLGHFSMGIVVGLPHPLEWLSESYQLNVPFNQPLLLGILDVSSLLLLQTFQ